MWDLQPAVQAVVGVAVASLLVPPLARGIGGICAVIGFCGVTDPVELLGADGDGVGDGGVVCRALVVRGPQ